MTKKLFLFVVLFSATLMAYGQNDSKQENSNGSETKMKVFEVVEQQPAFPGNLSQFLRDYIHYPTVAQENGIQGRVIVQFVVETDGSITDVRVVGSVDPSLDKEAIRVVKSMPKWKPGMQKGEPVRVRYTLPVNFRLGSPAKKAGGVQTQIGH